MKLDTTTKIKTSFSAIILVIALILVVFAPVGTTYANGDIVIILDFGNETTFYGIIDDPEEPNAYEALDIVCSIHNFSLIRNENAVISIDNVKSVTDGSSWGLYVVFKVSKYDPIEEYPWVKIDDDPHDIKLNDYAAVAWAFCSESEVPSRAVDATGMGFYGYGHPDTIVSLAPSCTEMICAVGGEGKIIGADDFSNYPESVELKRKSGEIDRIGGFSNPSYEKIISLNPKLVVCINSMGSHIDMMKKLRSTGVDVLMIDGGEDIDAVMESLMMVGTAMGVRETANTVVRNIVEDISIIEEIVNNNSSAPKNVMITLSTDNAPYVAGSGTYLSDIMEKISVGNSLRMQNGWFTLNSEFFIPKDGGPCPSIDFIVVILEDGPKTQAEYDDVTSEDRMSAEWKKTNAYINGNIYFLSGSAEDLASRSGPRVAQITELLARIIQNTAFEGEIPKFIGDEYKNYLSLTRDPVTEVSI